MADLPQPDGAKRDFEFELHYDLHSKSSTAIFDQIFSDSSPSAHIHSWDKKIIPSPVHAIARVGAKKYLVDNAHRALVTYSKVEEVIPLLWSHSGFRDVQDTAGDGIDSYLFFTKKAIIPDNRQVTAPADRTSSLERDPTLECAQGRIIYIKDKIPYIDRVSLLLFYAFCIRLQSEDYRFIRTFIERHLDLRCSMKLPYHWQELSPAKPDNSLHKCYKRVTISSHITYLTLNSFNEEEIKEIPLDRAPLFPFRDRTKTTEPFTLQLFKASASVLLTIAVPEESVSREEETRLLNSPQAIWTILVVSSSSDFISQYEPREYFTPIAQFVRGIVSSLHTQQVNALSIHDMLRNQLNSHDDGGIFDDEKFTKSTLYHWAIKTCDALAESLISSLRFVRGMLNNEVEKLCQDSHGKEQSAINHWKLQLRKEIFELEDLQAQIVALKSQVQESRNALHGVTSILEPRLALQQGERMKTFALLATVYLPLTASSAIYSMSVLPDSASFSSFFIVLAIFFILTTILILNLGTAVTKIRQPRFISTHISKLASPTKIYIYKYIRILNPYSDYKIAQYGHSSRIGRLVWWLLRASTIVILRSFLLPEIFMVVDQWNFFRYRNNVIIGVQFHLWLGIPNTIRAVLIPVWIGLAVAIVLYQVLLDLAVLIGASGANFIVRGRRALSG